MDKQKVLIIDDEETIRDVCSQFLIQEGYLVETSADGNDGLEKYTRFKPDVIIVDLKMPGISGFDVMEKMKQADDLVVIVVITGYATIESAVESLKKGAFDFLPKPFTADELTIIVRRALEKRQLATQAKRLREEKENMRQNFISLVSHEMRTPLVAAMQYLELMGGGMSGVLNHEQTRIVGRMKARLGELLALLDRWLKLARIEEHQISNDFENFDLASVVKEVLEIIKPLADEKKIKVKDLGGDEVKLYGDRNMIKEIIINLISNGIKYNREEGEVTIQRIKETGTAMVDIRDTGFGISNEELPRIGTEFYRVKREGLAAGSGLGLAIVKKILDIHKGKLEIKSTLDQGSTFRIYLPISAAAISKTTAAGSNNSTSQT